MPIPIIDLFAGPGGLGEGFSSFLDEHDERKFKIKLSIEKDAHAHQTLELRAFFRQFPVKGTPREYYDYIVGNINRDELFLRYPKQAERAQDEAWHAELGGEKTPNEEVDRRIVVALAGQSNKWLLIGGPPCQAYSLVGRSRVIGGEGLAEYEADPRHKLYEHYLRILAVHQPAVFVMENVKGLLSAKVKKEGIFARILEDLQHPLFATKKGEKEDLEYKLYPLIPTPGELLGYFEPEDFVLHSEDFQIPQARHRIIILGVRSGGPKPLRLLKNSKKQIPIEDVIGDLPKLRSGLSKEPDSDEKWRAAIQEIETAQWFKNGEVSTELRVALLAALKKLGTNLTRGGLFLPGASKPDTHKSWYTDSDLKVVCNHQTRSHIRADLQRYFFASVFAEHSGRSPLLEDFPKALLPKHENVEAALKETKFNDRFRVQFAGRPSTTVVSHISKDGHYYIHYDPSQCRSLTVREAARLQTFPDNYRFEGPRTEQYKQVGNAVPPLLARQIAEVVAELFD